MSRPLKNNLVVFPAASVSPAGLAVPSLEERVIALFLTTRSVTITARRLGIGPSVVSSILFPLVRDSHRRMSGGHRADFPSKVAA
jgi:hypothetical protein